MNRTIALLLLLKECGRIDGRKKLQKIVHLLREAGHPFQYRFGFHLHGPFSAELKGEVDLLSRHSLIEEKDVGSTDFPQYQFEIAENGVRLLEDLVVVGPPPWKSLAQNLNAKNAQELEAVSTIVYLLRNGSNEGTLETRFGQLKPQLAQQYRQSRDCARELIRV